MPLIRKTALHRTRTKNIYKKKLFIEVPCSILFAFIHYKGYLNGVDYVNIARLARSREKSISLDYSNLFVHTRGPWGNPHAQPLSYLSKGNVEYDRYHTIRRAALDQLDKIREIISFMSVLDSRPPLDEEEWRKNIQKQGESKSKAVFSLTRSIGKESLLKIDEISFHLDKEELIKLIDEHRKLLRDNDEHVPYLESSASVLRAIGLDHLKGLIISLKNFRTKYFFIEVTIDQIRQAFLEHNIVKKIYELILWDHVGSIKQSRGVEFTKPQIEILPPNIENLSLATGENLSIVCDAAIVSSCVELLMNTGYLNKDKIDIEQKVVVKAEYYSDHLNLKFTNYYSENEDLIKEKLRLKTGKWVELERLGGRVSHKFISEIEIEASLEIPFANYILERHSEKH